MLSSSSKWVWKQTSEVFFLRDVESHGHLLHHCIYVHIKKNSLHLIKTLKIVEKSLISQLCSPGLLLPCLLWWILRMPAGNQMSAATYVKCNWLGTFYLKQWKMNKPCCTGHWFCGCRQQVLLEKSTMGNWPGYSAWTPTKVYPPPRSFLFTHPPLISAFPTVLHPSKPRVLLAEMWLLIPYFHLLKCFSPL